MFFRKLCAVAALSILSACGGGGGGGGGAPLAATASLASIPANGTSTTVITVTGDLKFPVRLLTPRGTFVGGNTPTSISFSSGPVVATLLSCDSRAGAGCAGSFLVDVSDQSLASARVPITFVAIEICTDGIDTNADGLADCADLAACPAGVPCDGFGRVCNAGVGGAPGFCGCVGGATGVCCPGAANCADPLCRPATGRPGAQCDTGNIVGGNHVLGACTAAATCTCTGSGTETNCADGIDNDCDGLIDCADRDCQPVGNAPGKSCSTAIPGLTCSASGATGGTSTCSACAPGGSFANAQPVETKCGDGIDNDCNGLVDCLDPNCSDLTLACKSTAQDKGERCTADLQCRCPDTSGVETACGDGLDNDCDGQKDCADADCASQPCGANGLICMAGLCKCPGGQTTETTCNDGQDNDCDGLVDCADPDCRPTTIGGINGKVCAAVGRLGMQCDSLGQCACPGGQVSETTCDDALDNDCDGLFNCADSDCQGRSCGANGLICPVGGGACACPGGTTEICNNGVDDNCDGKTDCADPQCQGNPGALCGPVGSPTASYKCSPVTSGATTYACRDTSNFVLTLTATTARLAANGLASTTVTATLLDTTKTPPAVQNVPIAFSTALGTFLGAAAPGNAITALTDPSGRATVTYVSAATAGPAVVTGTYSYNAGANSVAGTTTVTLPLLTQITVAAQQYAIMGARGSGYQEANELSFQLTDATSLPYPAGLDVTFTHTSVGGSYIGADPSACDPVTKECVVAVPTDASGRARVILHSGTQATVTFVAASATGGGTTVSLNSGNIAIVGAKASGNEISINCTPKNIPALTDTDCSKSNYSFTDATITCTTSLADRFKNKLGVATLVELRTEAGAAGLPTSTPAYPSASIGRTTNTILTTGYGLPADVAPFAGEYQLDHAWDGCGTKTHNPRDGLVTIIAAVSGEEGFVDGSNGCPSDGLYNPAGSYPGFPSCGGEFFIDLGEPFVDYNDNGLRDANEPFIDTNGNQAYDGPNGQWDARTIIWSQTRVLYTGYTQAASDGTNNLASRFFDFPGPPLPPEPTPPATPFFVYATKTGTPTIPASSWNLPVYFADGNFNLPAARTTYAVSKDSGATLSAGYGPDSPSEMDSLGMSFTIQFCDRQVPTNPSTQCNSSCLFPVCYAVSNVGAFSYGTSGSVTVTGGATPDGGVCVYSSATLVTGGVTRTLSLGNCGLSAPRP
jgi:hypothetical protein